MRLLDHLPVTVWRVADRRDRINYERLNRLPRSGEWVRVVAGVFVPGPEWSGLLPHDRHRVRVIETVRRLRGDVILSHWAAASLWGIDVLGRWPDRVDVLTERTSGGRSSPGVRRWATGLEGVTTTTFGRHRLTTPARTALDLARALPFVRGVSAVDQALWSDRDGGALCGHDDLHELFDAVPVRGDRRARAALAFADPLAANVRESQSRVLIAELGFPEPRLQERRILRSGRRVFADLYFPTCDHWGELDGRGKYRDAMMLAGMSPLQALDAEKQREDEIRREVSGFSRWRTDDLDDPRRHQETGSALPSS